MTIMCVFMRNTNCSASCNQLFIQPSRGYCVQFCIHFVKRSAHRHDTESTKIEHYVKFNFKYVADYHISHTPDLRMETTKIRHIFEKRMTFLQNKINACNHDVDQTVCSAQQINYVNHVNIWPCRPKHVQDID